ncbi:MAG TPA: DUF333 domain-containing protein [Halomonas sp.]|nr:DUF333 domain-containing protein [Halomonas sp.]
MLKGAMYHHYLFVALLPLAGCAASGGDPNSQNEMTQSAAEYCESIGGETEVQETRLGTGRYCRLPDGRVENQWQLYRSERLDND